MALIAVAFVPASAFAQDAAGAADAATTVSRNDDQVVRLEEIEVRAPRTSALTSAVTDSPLDTLQPKSDISLQYISNNVVPTADYGTIVNIAPSAANIETNGPGLSEAKHTLIRGMDDGAYNVTFDGIPFGDYNTFSHHSTSYFPAKLLGRVSVDRGPGTASTIGNANFGGSLNLFSKDPRTEMSFVPTLSYGNWNTLLAHFEVNSGLMPALNNASVIASYQYMTTDGYRTNSDMRRSTYYIKWLQPIGQNVNLTFLSSVNHIAFGNPGTVTQVQIDTLGRNFGLSDNTPANTLDPNNRAYNYQQKDADFEYIGLDANLGGGWKTDGKLYTYRYYNNSHEKPKLQKGTNDMLGNNKINTYRSYGVVWNIVNDSDYGTFKAGVWAESNDNTRSTLGLNYMTYGADTVDLNPDPTLVKFAPVGIDLKTGQLNANPPYNSNTWVGQQFYNYSYYLVDKNSSFQPYAEYDWRPINNLDINAGARYMFFKRDFNAAVNQTGNREPLVATRKDDKLTPSVSVNYQFNNNWSGYAQIAQGFQSPSESNAFYVSDANYFSGTSTNIKPQISTNYQIGTVFKNNRFNADADVYYIDFQNYAYNGPIDSSGDPLYYGIAKGAFYYGAEVEGTYYLGRGLSLYANGSLEKARFKNSKIDVPTVPESTAAIGLSYDRGGFFASFTQKYIGRWTVYDAITNPDLPADPTDINALRGGLVGGGATNKLYNGGFSLSDFSIGYGFKLNNKFLKSVKARLQVSNVFNRKVQILEGTKANPTNDPSVFYQNNTFNVLPTRSYFLTVSAEF